MAECWSCGAERGEARFCTTCSKIQPVSKKTSLFDALELTPAMGVERAAIDKAFREVSRDVHPDRFGRDSAVERRLALEHTTRVNEAYRTLKDPQGRAEYLMATEGVAVAQETDRTADPALLMEMMELQEKIDGLSDEDDAEEMLGQAKQRKKKLLSVATTYFDERQGARDEVVSALDELRYVRRLIERIELRLEEMN